MSACIACKKKKPWKTNVWCSICGVVLIPRSLTTVISKYKIRAGVKTRIFPKIETLMYRTLLRMPITRSFTKKSMLQQGQVQPGADLSTSPPNPAPGQILTVKLISQLIIRT